MNVIEARGFVTRMLAVCNVYRPTGTAMHVMQAMATSKQRRPDLRDVYEVTLNEVLSSRPLDLDTLALLGGLFREAYLTTALDIALVLGRAFKKLLLAFCEQEWINDSVAVELEDLAYERVFHWHLGERWLGDDEYYDDLPPNVVARPLLAVSPLTEWLSNDADRLWEHWMSHIDAWDNS